MLEAGSAVDSRGYYLPKGQQLPRSGQLRNALPLTGHCHSAGQEARKPLVKADAALHQICGLLRTACHTQPSQVCLELHVYIGKMCFCVSDAWYLVDVCISID